MRRASGWALSSSAQAAMYQALRKSMMASAAGALRQVAGYGTAFSTEKQAAVGQR
jgi:hypothetical protein